MTEIIKIENITFHIESKGFEAPYTTTDALMRRALASAAIHAANDGDATYMHPVEDGSSIIEVKITDLESSNPNAQTDLQALPFTDEYATINQIIIRE